MQKQVYRIAVVLFVAIGVVDFAILWHNNQESAKSSLRSGPVSGIHKAPTVAETADLKTCINGQVGFQLTYPENYSLWVNLDELNFGDAGDTENCVKREDFLVAPTETRSTELGSHLIDLGLEVTVRTAADLAVYLGIPNYATDKNVQDFVTSYALGGFQGNRVYEWDEVDGEKTVWITESRSSGLSETAVIHHGNYFYLFTTNNPSRVEDLINSIVHSLRFTK